MYYNNVIIFSYDVTRFDSTEMITPFISSSTLKISCIVISLLLCQDYIIYFVFDEANVLFVIGNVCLCVIQYLTSNSSTLVMTLVTNGKLKKL